MSTRRRIAPAPAPVVLVEDTDEELESPSIARDYVPVDEAGIGRAGVVQRAADDQAGTTLFVASTDAPDRAMDVVKQDWRLANFRSNPVILDNHNPMRVVGHAAEVKVPKNGDDAGKLMIRVAWDLSNPDSTIAAVGHQHLNGIRRAGSVGFRATKTTPRDKLPADHPYYQEPVKVQTWYGEAKYAGQLFEGNELFEFSSATIPMNPQALQRSFAAALAGRGVDDVDGRLGLVAETVPRAVAADLASLVRDAAPEQRAALVDLLWPDVIERVRAEMRAIARTDTEFRRIVQAYDAARPAHHVDLLSRVAQLIAS